MERGASGRNWFRDFRLRAASPWQKKSCHLTLKFVKCPEFATAQAELGAKCPRSGCLYGKGRVEWSRNGACLNRIL